MGASLRVCHVITQLELGGAQRNTLYTLEHLNGRTFETSLICGRGGILDEEARKGTFPVLFVKPLVREIRPWRDLAALITLYRALRRSRPQIVHTHSSKAGILGRLAAYLAGVPVIVHTFHGFGFTPRQATPVRWLYVALEWLCARLSTHLIFVSEDNQREARCLGITRRKSASLIRSGIEMKHTPPARLRQELGIPPDSWVVVSVGNFKPQKNPMDLMRTAEAVLTKDPSIHFVFTGEGPLLLALKAWVKEHHLRDHIHLVGWREDARALISAGDAFLLTSLWEGLPRALVEAMAEKKPAVAYGVNGVNDILEDGRTGFLIPPGETQLAAEKLLWLKSHPTEAHRLGESGRHRVETEFDINTMVRQQEDLYASLYERVPLKSYYEPLWSIHEKL